MAGAVKRNYFKRLIRESYRLNENKIDIGNSIVFLIKKRVNIDEINFQNVQNDLSEILRKIGQV